MQDAASELLYPLLPILLTTVLGAPAVVVGLVEGVAEGSAALLKYASGRFSDRVGRKSLVTTGYSLAAFGKVIVAAAG
ncbi:MAG TPA: MFS transporter, partial [Actinomycetes bacterium]|nr:MFS transporter [Actinomycetes bacterium]